MKYSMQVEMFRNAKTKYMGFLSSVLWKLTGDRELFTEAMQNSLLQMWKHADKLNGPKAKGYIYRIALSANSKAWKNRIGRNGELTDSQKSALKDPAEKVIDRELTALIRRKIATLGDKQGRAIIMRYLEQKDYKAIASDLRCTQASARSHVSRALSTLKLELTNLAEGVIS